MFNKQYTAGYSLVEVLVAISILLLSLVGPMTIAFKGLQSSYYAKEQVTAIFLAQEGIEAFIAARNDETIMAFSAGDLSTGWDWVSDVSLNPCYAASGCGVDYVSTSPLTSIQSCVTIENCRLYFNASSTRARYSLTSAGAETSPYIRVIKLTADTSGRGIIVESAVYWDSVLLGSDQSVTLTGAIFNIYE